MRRALLGCLLGAARVAGRVELSPLFSDGAVLQTNFESGMRSLIYGRAAPGETVSVAGAHRIVGKAPFSTVTDSKGRWRIQLDPYTHPKHATNSFALTVSGSATRDDITLRGVTYGDVYLCAGGGPAAAPGARPPPGAARVSLLKVDAAPSAARDDFRAASLGGGAAGRRSTARRTPRASRRRMTSARAAGGGRRRPARGGDAEVAFGRRDAPGARGQRRRAGGAVVVELSAPVVYRDARGCAACCKRDRRVFQISRDGDTWASAGAPAAANGTIVVAPAGVVRLRYDWLPAPECVVVGENGGLPLAPFVLDVGGGAVARTPPMGYNTWNYFHCNVDERAVVRTARLLIDLGLAAKGYAYVNVDDCWQAVADAVHALGMKYGLYTASHEFTCQGRPGSYLHETRDADAYCAFEVDYNNWASVLANADATERLWSLAGPGHWNDPDMLLVGNVGLDADEARAHFSIWCMLAAPLLIGTDLHALSAENLAILGNEHLIAIDQDPLGFQGRKVVRGAREVWMKQLANGDVAVMLLNRDARAARVSAKLDAVGLAAGRRYAVFDCWRGKAAGTAAGSFAADVRATARRRRLSPDTAGRSRRKAAAC
ncbi:alpha-galactosidase [Aureococcus anophagefferens]|nr:alpha-galactosidase [Aureococcus anophagefferens]